MVTSYVERIRGFGVEFSKLRITVVETLSYLSSPLVDLQLRGEVVRRV